jgi:uncharacterized membrane protein YkvA (DUF1232 family)
MGKKITLYRKIVSWIKAIFFLTIALSYALWPLDFIPDFTGAVIGWIDDAIVFVVVGYLIMGLQAFADKANPYRKK